MPFEIILSLVAWKPINLEQARKTRVAFVQDWNEFEIVIYSKRINKVSNYVQNGNNVNHFNSKELRIVVSKRF